MRPAALACAAAVAVAGAFAAAEARLRATDPRWNLAAPEDPPWVSFLGVKRVFDLPDAADRGALRKILCVGGSTTAGYPFPHAGYPEWLQLELGRCGGTQLRAINRGVGSYGTLREPVVLGQELPVLKPSVVVLASGHNEVQERMLYDGIPSPLKGALGRSLAGTALGTALLRSLPKLGYHGEFQGPWGLPSALKRPPQDSVENAFEAALRSMVRATKAAGAVPVVCVTPADLLYPLGDSERAAFTRLHRPGKLKFEWYGLFARARALRASGKPLEALALLDRLPPEAANPHVDWLRGACLHDTGRWKEARALLRAAPNRFLAGERMRQAQRRVASEEGAVLVDLEAAFTKGRPDGLPDSRYFSDGHHLSALGYRVQAREILRALAARGEVPKTCPASWSGRDDGMLARDLKLQPRYEATAAALQANAAVLYYMGSNNPWFKERAESLLVEALKADPDAGFTKHLRADLPLVASAMAQASRKAGRADLAGAWDARAAKLGADGE